MLDVKTWTVRLAGSRFDLSSWAVLFYHCPDPRVEIDRSGTAPQATGVASARLNGLTDLDQLHDVAEYLIDQMNGAASTQYAAGRVHIAGFTAVLNDGTLQERPFGRPAVRGVVRLGPAINKDGSPPRAASQAQGRLLYALSDANPLVSEALTYSGRADNWFDLFKLLEVIQTAVGSRENIWKLGWATRGEITRFAMTANHVRHAKKPRPAHALHLDQAQDLMRRVLTRWLDSLPRNGG